MKIKIETEITISGSDEYKRRRIMDYVHYLRSLHVSPNIIDGFLQKTRVFVDRPGDKESQRTCYELDQFTDDDDTLLKTMVRDKAK